MNAKKSALLAVLSLVMIGAGVTTASADTPWQAQHPRREQVNERLNHQFDRIRQDRREGEIGPGEAARLHHADFRVRLQERRFARFHDGHISRAERGRLNREENRIGRHIPA